MQTASRRFVCTIITRHFLRSKTAADQVRVTSHCPRQRKRVVSPNVVRRYRLPSFTYARRTRALLPDASFSPHFPRSGNVSQVVASATTCRVLAMPRGSYSQTPPLNLQTPLSLDHLYYTTNLMICQVLFTNLCIIFRATAHPFPKLASPTLFAKRKRVVAPNAVRRYCSHAVHHAVRLHRQLPLHT